MFCYYHLDSSIENTTFVGHGLRENAPSNILCNTKSKFVLNISWPIHCDVHKIQKFLHALGVRVEFMYGKYVNLSLNFVILTCQNVFSFLDEVSANLQMQLTAR